MIQGSAEWHEARLGCFTSSRAKELMTNGRGGKPSKTRDTLICALMAERITGKPNDSAESYAMHRGTELEPLARSEYIIQKGTDVEEVGFIKHPTLPNCGSSVDGLVGDDGCIEIKCPLTEWRHVQSLEGHVDDDYAKQRQWHLWVTGRAWLDAISFHDKFPADQQLAVGRIMPDLEMHKQFEAAVTEGEAEIIRRLTELGIATE